VDPDPYDPLTFPCPVSGSTTLLAPLRTSATQEKYFSVFVNETEKLNSGYVWIFYYKNIFTKKAVANVKEIIISSIKNFKEMQ
jgi:hypothetical protein